MYIITGDETGLLKLVNVTNRNYIKYGDYQSRDYGISDVMYIKEKRMILSLKINSTIDMYSIIHSNNNDVDVDYDVSNNLIYRKSIDNIIIEKPKAFQNIISNHKRSDVITIYNTIGDIATYRVNDNNNDSNAYCIDNISNFNINNNIEVSDTCHNGEILFGGKENDAKIYNIETQQMIWNALNVSQDKLHLRVPIWITAIAFQQPYINNNIFYTGTAYKHIRMYDTKSSQRPIVSIDIGGDYRISSICPSINSSIKDDDDHHHNDSDASRYLYVGDTSGGLSLWDMRQQRRLHVMKSAAGSIRRMVTSDDGQYLACVGLDRFLRVYDTTTNAITDAVYLKNRLNCCLFAEIGSGDSSRGGVVKRKRKKNRRMAVQNEDDDDLLEVVGDDDDDDDEEDDDDDDEEDDDEEEDDDNDDDEEDKDEDEEQEVSEDEVVEDYIDIHQPPLLKKLTVKQNKRQLGLHSRNINADSSGKKKGRHTSIH